MLIIEKRLMRKTHRGLWGKNGMKKDVKTIKSEKAPSFMTVYLVVTVQP